MIVSYFRSSSYSTYDFCPMKFFIGYTLGHREPVNKKATLGSMTHKALECMARKKLAMQRGEPSFKDDETGIEFNVHDFEARHGADLAFDYYSKRETHHEWSERDRRQCYRWTLDAMEMDGGLWDPMKRDVVVPEQYFDLSIEQPWARYAYRLPDGRRIEGSLALKGTVDLVTRVSGDTLEYIDWKTGKEPKDWATGKLKDWKALREDPQLRIYHYALTKLYPEVPHIVISIVYIQHGSSYSFPFGPEDLVKTEDMLRQRYERVRDCSRPNRIMGDPIHGWKCERLCHFGKTKWNNTRRSICDHLHNEVVTLGMEKVMKKHALPGAFDSYGQGGGRSDAPEKE
jgi:hypothetical protein